MTPRLIGQFRAGFFRIRLVPRGPFVAAALHYGPPLDPDTGDVLDRSWRWQGWLGGRPVGVLMSEDDHQQPDAFQLWRIAHGEEIGREEYLHLVDVARWAKTNHPQLPEANPGRPVALDKMRSLL